MTGRCGVKERGDGEGEGQTEPRDRSKSLFESPLHRRVIADQVRRLRLSAPMDLDRASRCWML